MKTPEKIGILGGTFNPVHNGHISMAAGFCEKLGLDRVLLVPVWLPPHKNAENLVSAEDRLAMCRAACEGDGRLAVSDVEIVRRGRSYTVDTLRELSRVYAGSKLYLLMGADMFLTVEKWKSFTDIIRYATVCCAARRRGEWERLHDYARRLREKYGVSFLVEDIPVLEISSTEVRRRIASGENTRELIPPGVAEYIAGNGLYGARKT